MVAEEMPKPVSEEFRLLYDRQNYGLPLPEALRAFAERIPIIDARFFVTAVLTQREAGGNLSEVLDKIGGTIKERIRLQGEIRTLTTQGRFSVWIVSLLPAVLAVAMQVIQPGYLTPMLTHPLGWLMLGFGVVMLTTGVLIIKNMVNLEV
jgi:tight adherence protein B